MIKKLILLAGVLLFASCEQPVVEEDFPYDPKLVVRAVIDENELIEDIYIGRTLPVGVEFISDFSDLSDAVGAVVHDGIFYPLRHTGKGLYTTDSLIAQRGERYFLLVNWENLAARAETIVPRPGAVSHLNLIGGSNNARYLEATIRTVNTESYAVTWVGVSPNGTITREAEAFAEVGKGGGGNSIIVPTTDVPPSILNNPDLKVGVKLYTYDEPFYHYFITSGSNQISDAVFGQPGTNIRWNVEGDGIGMFLGRVIVLHTE